MPSTSNPQHVGPLRVETLANGGPGIARHCGRVIFIPGTVPGDLVVGRLVREKKRYAEAELVEILEPSAQRVVPPCPVADECGGCQWQQMPYAAQLSWKERLFRESLIRQCQLSADVFLPIQPSPRQWGYRSRVQIKCHQAGDQFVCGFYRPKSRFVVAIETCPVIAPELNDLLVEMRAALTPTEFANQVPQLDLAIGDDGRRRAVVHYLGQNGRALCALLDPLARRLETALLIQQGRKDSLRSISGDPDLAIRVDQPPLDLRYGAGGFAQINLAQNRLLVDAALEAAQLTGAERVLDLYCGMGNFSLPLARRAHRVIGVEDFAPSIAMARRNAASNRLANVEFHVCAAEDALRRFGGDPGFDLVLLDPPRSGAYALAKQLCATPVRRVVYISCDPQTLARDLQPMLHGGYRLVSSQAFDMFPHTHHVESLTVLEYSS